jgi:3'-phosphoadenosine 5'-phosphosulfate sulfotransferase (PAPS reductase)/FAD synthetase
MKRGNAALQLPLPLDVCAGAPIPELDTYDHIIVAISGGADSTACLLRLVELGVEPHRIEAWHHLIDGDAHRLFDWPITEAYCRKLTAELGIPLYFSYRLGGLEREMLRKDAPTGPIAFETPDGTLRRAGGESDNRTTRLKFPMPCADLKRRWCSAAGKIQVSDAAIRNQDRFLGRHTLFVTGERAEESKKRAGYAELEPHRTDTRAGNRRPRRCDHWRPVFRWLKHDIWEILRRHGIVPHPAYYLHWSRTSCLGCIFGSCDQYASFRAIAPEQFQAMADYETQFGYTIHFGETIHQRADRGTPYDMDPALIALAMSDSYDAPIRVDPAVWQLPGGAHRELVGPP